MKHFDSHLSLSLLLCVFSMTSCISIPVDRAEESPFSKRNLEFIVNGTTTKEEIREKFGGPEVLEEERWWLYRRRGESTEWLNIYLAGRPDSLTDTHGGKLLFHLLFVELNEDGTARDHTVFVHHPNDYGPVDFLTLWVFKDNEIQSIHEMWRLPSRGCASWPSDEPLVHPSRKGLLVLGSEFVGAAAWGKHITDPDPHQKYYIRWQHSYDEIEEVDVESPPFSFGARCIVLTLKDGGHESFVIRPVSKTKSIANSVSSRIQQAN